VGRGIAHPRGGAAVLHPDFEPEERWGIPPGRAACPVLGRMGRHAPEDLKFEIGILKDAGQFFFWLLTSDFRFFCYAPGIHLRQGYADRSPGGGSGRHADPGSCPEGGRLEPGSAGRRPKP
jgi:hypothetical protein